MADDFNSKLNGLLSDPNAIRQIMSMASGLMNKSNDRPQPEEPTVESFQKPEMPFQMPKDDRCELLCALKPFLKSDKAQKIDLMIRILQIANLTKRN